MLFGVSVLDITSDISKGTRSQEKILIVQILSHTPIWVFALFVILLVFGLMQSRTRTVSLIPALQLPAGMIALSLTGIYFSFGFRTMPPPGGAPFRPFLPASLDK
jgi:protein-S-isoprenylcysteine O-methyltransferase Ste14